MCPLDLNVWGRRLFLLEIPKGGNCAYHIALHNGIKMIVLVTVRVFQKLARHEFLMGPK